MNDLIIKTNKFGERFYLDGIEIKGIFNYSLQYEPHTGMKTLNLSIYVSSINKEKNDE